MKNLSGTKHSLAAFPLIAPIASEPGPVAFPLSLPGPDRAKAGHPGHDLPNTLGQKVQLGLRCGVKEEAVCAESVKDGVPAMLVF